MHDRWKDDFEEALVGMDDEKKAQLIERIARSMKPTINAQPRLTPAQVAARLAEIAALSVSSPDDGFSARDHDLVLYGSSRGPLSSS